MINKRIIRLIFGGDGANILTCRMLIPIIAASVILLNGSTFYNDKGTKLQVHMGYSISSFQDVEAIDASAAISVYVDTFRDRVQKRLNKNITFTSKVYNSIKEMIDALNHGEVDILSISADEYFALKKQADVSPCIAVVNKEDPSEQYCILKRKDSPINKLGDFSGKILDLPTLRLHPMLEEWLFNLLMKNKMPEIKKTFGQVIISDKESSAVYNVFFNKADLAIVRKSVWDAVCDLNPQLNKSLTVFMVSPPMVLSFTVSNNKSDQEIIKIIIDEAALLHLTTGGKNILQIFKADRAVKISEKDLRYAKEILDENNAFRNHNSALKKKKLR